MEHEDYMREALSLAREAAQEGEVPVGCVIVKDGEIIAEGWHRKAGEAHAEIDAIEHAKAPVAGATGMMAARPRARP